MFTEAHQMPSDARIWIYQSNRAFTNEEEQKISLFTKNFLESWTAHQQDLKASFEMRYNLFLIIMIDHHHANASGCSIDKLLHFIQQLEKEFSVSMLDRQLFAVKFGNDVAIVKRKDFESLISKGEINGDSIVFNNLVETKSELENKWEVPFKESWHSAIITI
jgi:hypothetical protein